tara:strand:+ start:23296 stop:24363 length:1068 start_codon:yes stop_codon:yes gene_type:complete
MIKFASLRVETIGHLILNTIRFFSEKKYNYLIIVSNPDKIINRFVYDFLKKNYQNKKIIFLESKIISDLIEIFYKVQKRLKFLSIFYANLRWIHHDFPRIEYGSPYRFYDSFLRNKKKFIFQKKYEKIFQHWKKANKINEKFVCIFGRDNGYYNEKYKNPRNFKFSNYKKLINKLIKLNYTVIRMSRKNNENFYLKNKKYIDFNNIIKNEGIQNIELIEFMLFKKCEFIVGSTSGIHAYASLFDKFFFYVNNFPVGRIPYFKNCLFINKKYKKLKKIVPYNKIDRDILLSENYSIIKKRGYTVVDNNQNEIYNLVIKNIKKKSTININKHSFIVEGEGALCCKRWYTKNLKLFKN